MKDKYDSLSCHSAGATMQRHHPNRHLLIALLLWLSSLTGQAQTGGSKIYWVQASGTATDDRLRVANLDGSSGADLASGNSAATFAQPQSLWVDAASNVVYVGDGASAGSTGISRFNATTGAYLNNVVAGAATTSFNGVQVAGNRLYWVQSSGTAADDRLCVANLDGTNVTVLASGNSATTFSNPQSLWVDAASNVVYVGDGASAGSTGISRFNATTGAYLNNVVAGAATTSFNGVQVAGNRLYWVQSSGTAADDRLCVANPDGTNVTVLASGNSAATFAQPQSLRVDAAGNVVYVGDGASAGSTGISRFNATTGTYLDNIVAGTATISYNGLALNTAVSPDPPVVNVLANGSATNSTTPTYSGTAAGGNTVTVYVDGISIGTTTAPGSNWTLVQPTALASGSHTIYATATVDGSVSANSATNTFTVDTTPPNTTITATPNNPSNNSLATFVFTGTDGSGSGIASYQTSLDGSAFTVSTSPRTYPGLADGQHTFQVRAVDRAGNVDATPDSYTWTIDTSAPTVILTSAAGVSGGSTTISPLSFTATFSEPVTGLVDTEVTVSNGTSSGFAGSGTTYTFTVTPTTSGLVTVKVPANVAQDAAGNGNTPATPYTITYAPNQAPTSIALSSTAVNENAPVNTAVGSFTSADTDTPAQTFSYSLVSGLGSADNAAFTLVGNTLFTSAVFDFEAKNTYFIRVRTTDSGSPALSVEQSFTIAVTNLNELVATITNQTNVSCQGGSNGSATVTASNENGPFSYNWTPGNPTGNGTATVTGLAAGTYSVVVTATNSGFSATAVVTLTQPPAVALTVSPSTTVVCGGPVTLTATSSASSPSFAWTGTTPTSGSVVSVTNTGLYSVTVTDAGGCTATAATSLTINPLPSVRLTGLASTYCQNTAAVMLMGNPSGGTFTIDNITATVVTPASLSVGQHTVVYSYTNASGCSATASQTVTIQATPTAPVIATQSGQSYPAGQSNLTISQNVGNVIFTVSGCAGGTITWAGGNNTTLAVSTFDAGVQTFTATCSQNGCTSPLTTATLTVVGTTLSVLHRDGNGNATTNTLSPYVALQNDGNTAIPYQEITVRYWLTVENPTPLLFAINYAQVGSDKVRLRYVPATTANPGATGYIEYSFDASAGSLGAGGNSGPIQPNINKQDYSAFDQRNDYSYAAVGNFTPNERITAYRNGVLFYGLEPGPIVPTQSVKALLQNNTGDGANTIEAVLSVINDGNVPVNYGDLKVRYYFTADNAQPLVVSQVGFTALGSGNVMGEVVSLSPALGGADRYLEVSFSASLGQLAPGASTGGVTHQIRHADYSGFTQLNDYSYQGTGSMMQNRRVVVFVAGKRAYGTEPVAGGRLSAANVETPLGVEVLGNPVVGSVVEVLVRGAEGEPLTLSLTEVSGRSVSTRQVERAGAAERQRLEVGNSPAGLLLLRVSTPSQSQTVKVLKAN